MEVKKKFLPMDCTEYADKSIWKLVNSFFTGPAKISKCVWMLGNQGCGPGTSEPVADFFEKQF